MNGEVDSGKKVRGEEQLKCKQQLDSGRSKDFVTLWRQVKISLEKWPEWK